MIVSLKKAAGTRGLLIIHGAARGADQLAGRIAQELDIDTLEFPANWDKHGKAAGMIRNAQMLKEGRPELVVAVRGGRGTAGMVKLSRAADIPVHVVGD